jgi:hypothetical protein
MSGGSRRHLFDWLVDGQWPSGPVHAVRRPGHVVGSRLFSILQNRVCRSIAEIRERLVMNYRFPDNPLRHPAKADALEPIVI